MQSNRKYCGVPECRVNSVKYPEKLFFSSPTDQGKRSEWLRSIRRYNFSTKTRFFICEDHFDLKNDLENFTKYLIAREGFRHPLKPGVKPHIFECQGRQEEQNSTHEDTATVKTEDIVTVKTEDVHNSETVFIDELNNEIDQPSSATLDCNDPLEIGTQSENCDQNRSSSSRKVFTCDRGMQCCIKTVYWRSKATQTPNRNVSTASTQTKRTRNRIKRL